MSDVNSRNGSFRIELAQLRYAVAAADYGSFRRAAEILNVRQSTLSRSIRQFEQATSVSIFNRSSGGVALSPSGRSVIQKARVVLEQLETLGSAPEQTPELNKLCVGFSRST